MNDPPPIFFKQWLRIVVSRGYPENVSGLRISKFINIRTKNNVCESYKNSQNKFFFQDSLVNKIKVQHPTHGVNILVIKSGTSLLSKIFSTISHVYRFKKYDYPRVTQAVSNNN